SNARPNVGDTITFTVTLTNAGPNGASNVEVTDLLPTGLTLVSATPSQGTYISGVWAVGSVARLGQAKLTLTATVDSPDDPPEPTPRRTRRPSPTATSSTPTTATTRPAPPRRPSRPTCGSPRRSATRRPTSATPSRSPWRWPTWGRTRPPTSRCTTCCRPASR